MLKDRLYQARKAKGYSRESLAQKAGVSTSTITFLENGRNESSKFLVEIATALDVSAEWLKGEDAEQSVTGLNEAKSQNGMIPIISWAMASNWCNIDSLEPEDVIRWLTCPIKNHSKNTFALRVSGISMYNPYCQPSVEDGDIIFVDPEKSAENKSCVVVSIDNNITATFKQLIIEDGQQYLQTLNPHWPDRIIKMENKDVIHGVVIGKWVEM